MNAPLRMDPYFPYSFPPLLSDDGLQHRRLLAGLGRVAWAGAATVAPVAVIVVAVVEAVVPSARWENC